MTDEQKQTVAEIRNSVKKWGSLSVGGAVEQIETLLEIIDDLQKTIGDMAERIDLQTDWMLKHGISKTELGDILTKLAEKT